MVYLSTAPSKARLAGTPTFASAQSIEDTRRELQNPGIIRALATSPGQIKS